MRCKTIWKYLCTRAISAAAFFFCESSKKSKYFFFTSSFRHLLAMLWTALEHCNMCTFFLAERSRLNDEEMCIFINFHFFVCCTLGGKSFWIWFRLSVICTHASSSLHARSIRRLLSSPLPKYIFIWRECTAICHRHFASLATVRIQLKPNTIFVFLWMAKYI